MLQTGEGLGVQTPIRILPHNSAVKCMLVTNKHIITGTEEDLIYIWDKEVHKYIHLDLYQ